MLRIPFEWFESLESNSKQSSEISNHSKGIRSIRIEIWITRKGFEEFECKFEKFEKDAKHLNANPKHPNANSNRSKGIRSIRMQMRTNRKGFEAFECKFEAFECKFKGFKCKFKPFKNDLNHKFWLFEKDSKHLNSNSNHPKGIRSSQIQIRTTRKGFEWFGSKFKPHENVSISNSMHSKEIRSIWMQIPTIWKAFQAFESKFKPLESS